MHCLSAQRRGRVEGQAGSWAWTEADGNKLAWLYKTIPSKNQLQLKIQFALWTREMIAKLIWKRWRIKLSLASVGRLLAQLGISCQKPLHRAVEHDEALTKKWLRSEYPRIKALAQREHAPIFFADAAHVRSDHYVRRTWGKVRRRRSSRLEQERASLGLNSAITSKGHIRFMITEGSVNAGVFIEFLKRLLSGATQKIFLIR